MALVSLISWRGLASVSSARDWIESQAEDTDAIVRSLGQLGRDVELSYDGPVFDPVGGDTVALSAGVRLLRPPSGGAVLEILRPHPDSRPVQRVLARAPDGLWRASGAASARGPLPPDRRRRAVAARRQGHDAASGFPAPAGPRLPAPRRPAATGLKSPCSAATRRRNAIRVMGCHDPPHPAPPRRDQRGAAVISALIIVAIVAALTTSLFQRQTASVRRLENEAVAPAGACCWPAASTGRGWWCATTGSAQAVTRKDQIWATPSWTRASSVPATSAWPCSPRAGGRTGQVQPVQPGARRRAAAGRGTGAAAAAGPAAPAGHASAAHHRHRGHGPAAGAAPPKRRPPQRSRPPARRCRAACRNWAPRWAWIPPCATNCNAP